MTFTRTLLALSALLFIHGCPRGSGSASTYANFKVCGMSVGDQFQQSQVTNCSQFPNLSRNQNRYENSNVRVNYTVTEGKISAVRLDWKKGRKVSTPSGIKLGDSIRKCSELGGGFQRSQYNSNVCTKNAGNYSIHYHHQNGVVTRLMIANLKTMAGR